MLILIRDDANIFAAPIGHDILKTENFLLYLLLTFPINTYTMQLLPRYLVKNRIDIVADLAGFTTEYRPVYKRQAIVYKGIDNVLEFRLLNADQKPINTQGYTPKFRAYDQNNSLVN